MVPPAGALVAVWEGGELVVGVVAAEEKRRVRLIVRGGRELRVAPNRLAFVIEPSGAPPGSTQDAQREAGQRAEQADARIRALADAVDVAVLWAVVVEDDAGSRTLTTTELAELALDSRAGQARVAVVRALRAEGVHFARRGEQWEARDEKQVADLLRERQRVAERERQTRELFSALREVARGGAFRPSGGEYEARYLDALRQLAIDAEAAPEAARKMALEALQASGRRFDRPEEGAFRLLRSIGRFADDDANLQVLRYGFRTRFADDLVALAEQVAARGFEAEAREDLSELEAVSIDSPHTREIDDALSLEALERDRVRLGVHIADPGAFVRPDDPLDREALARGLTHYHPDLRLTMLPAVLAEDAASLVPGHPRPALSFFVDLDDAGTVLDARAARSIIRSSARLDYRSADRTLERGDGPHLGLLRGLSRFASQRECRREQQGAVRILAPEIDLHLEPDGTIRLERIEADSAARRVVSEAMILAGEIAARLCAEAGLAAIYRRQPPADPSVELPPGGVRDPVAVRRVRRALGRAEIGLRPGRHHGLGLDAYAQVTSPLRRYQDLATQRQLTAHLAGRTPPYDATTMQRIAATTEQAEADARRAERAAEEYWLLRYLEGRQGEELTAVVVETDPRPVVQLSETLREQPLPSLQGVVSGQSVLLCVERVNPRAGLLVLRRVG